MNQDRTNPVLNAPPTPVDGISLSRLRVGCLLSSASRKGAGLMTAVSRWANSIAQRDWDVQVFTLIDEFTEADASAWLPTRLQGFPTHGPKAFGYAPRLPDALNAASLDLLHVHGLWMYPSVATLRWHHETRRPYIVSPHGMLDPWALQNSGTKKRIAAALFERRHLQRAACLHALCESEADSIRAYGLRNPICVIPNGIDLPELAEGGELRVEGQFGAPHPEIPHSGVPRSADAAGIPRSAFRVPRSKRVLLYLGRLHPKKNLAALLRAWKALRPEGWCLAIAGWDQGGHEEELKRLAAVPPSPHQMGRGAGGEVGEELIGKTGSGTSNIEHRTSNTEPAAGLQPADRAGSEVEPSAINDPPFTSEDSIFFLGPQFGEAKAACYAQCDAFILPSVSEGLPMVILEAWAHGKTVLMTSACNLPEGYAANAAVQIGTDAGSIAEGLRSFFALSESARTEMGARGRALVAERFTWSTISAQMAEVYAWVTGHGPKPACVRE